MSKSLIYLLGGALVVTLIFNKFYKPHDDGSEANTFAQKARSEEKILRANLEQMGSRLALLEQKLLSLESSKLEVYRNSEKLGQPDTHSVGDIASNTSNVELDYLGYDPYSPEGIARENQLQQRYVQQVERLYQSEEIDFSWAGDMEATVLAALTDFGQQHTQSTENESSGTESDNSIGENSDIAISNFECKTNLCQTEVIAGSTEEMIAYQNFMVDQTKQTLPSIVFGTIEPYGNKFLMKAFMARDTYEYPAPE